MVEFGLGKSTTVANKPTGISYLTLPRRNQTGPTMFSRSPSPVKPIIKVEPIDIQVEVKDNMIGKEFVELVGNLNLHSKEMKELSSNAIKQQKVQEDKIEQEKVLEAEKQKEFLKKAQAEATAKLELVKETANKKAAVKVAQENQIQEVKAEVVSKPMPILSTEIQKPIAQNPIPIVSVSLVSQECSDAASEQASIYIEITTEIKKNLKPKLLQIKPIQDQLMRTKMKINKAMGQLTNSQVQIINIAKQATEIFTQSQSNDEFYKVVLYLTAKKICKQAQMECAVRKECSFPLAIVCVYLSSKHPDFLPILIGRMFTVCCFLIPSYPVKQKDESSVDFLVRCGYKIVSKDDQGMSVLENEVQFGERMGGLIALYSAIVQTDISN
jgi:hypothetical protein